MDCPRRRDSEAVAGLPDDPLVEILSRVPVKSLCCCKCVSKAWRDLITDPLNRKKLPQTLEKGSSLLPTAATTTPIVTIETAKTSPVMVEMVRTAGGWVSVHFIDVFGRPQHPVDHCFPFLTELPGIEEFMLLDGCNGILLFGCILQGSGKSFCQSYIVSNPATEQWVAVPDPDTDTEWFYSSIYLVFDPAASSQFHLVEINVLFELAMRIYSSNSGVWSPVGIDWGDLHNVDDGRHFQYAYANGMLYVVVSYGEMNQIVVMDVEGNTRKIIPGPLQEGVEFSLHYCAFVGQSQGRLHLIYHAELDCYNLDYDEIPPENQSYELSIWVLEDYDIEEWVLKDTVSSLKLFGSISPGTTNICEVVAIHPDCNLVFLIQHYKDELLSYNMDSKEVCRLCTIGTGIPIFPYVPYFSELSALENKH